MNLRRINLTASQYSELKTGYEKDKSSTFRKRCHIILLKSEGRTSKDVERIVGLNQIAVNNWLTRYEEEGISGLRTRPGRGRKPILDEELDAEKVKAAIKNERQRLKMAKSTLEQELDKSFSLQTLKCFLKNLSANGSE